MTLGDVTGGEHRPRLVEAVVGYAAWGVGGGTAVACDSKNTKLPEPTFRGVLGDDTRGPRFAAATRALRLPGSSEPKMGFGV
jgi:hypothetical protein